MSLKLPKIIPREDVTKILAVPNVRTAMGLRNRTILQVMYRAGLRVQEVCNLTMEDVNLKDGFLYVQGGKGDKDRYIPLDSDTISWCQRWREAREKWLKKKGLADPGFFFPTMQGTQLDQRWIRRFFHTLSEKTGVMVRDGRKLKKIHPHLFRHTCLTELLNEGFTIREVQQVAGHASIMTTSVYTHVLPELLAEKVRSRAPV